MRKIILLALAATACFAAIAPAEARDGCGIGFHRGPYGYCRPDGRPVVVVPAGPAYGVFYPGRGYWVHRERWHGGWRYRDADLRHLRGPTRKIGPRRIE
jgi:hypothetical protein